MGAVHDGIEGRLAAFVEAQHVFFVATAPSGGDGHVNVSPRGLADTFAGSARTPAHGGTLGGVDPRISLVTLAVADPVQSAVRRSWGAYTGYFADPDGFRWEVAHNPGLISDLVLP